MRQLRHLAGLAALLLIAACDGPAQGGSSGSEGTVEGEGGGLFAWVRRAVELREPYALDDASREVKAGGQVECDRESLERYRGDVLRFEPPLNVHPAFIERLLRFEKVAKDTAVELYGREPKRVRHAGAFACRTVRGRETRLSEHALGNALDVTGFSFARHVPDESAGKPGAEEPPRPLRRPFEVIIRDHWITEDEEDAIHQRFLRTLTERLEEERVFRGMIGPSQAGHERHLHLDAGPYRYIRL